MHTSHLINTILMPCHYSKSVYPNHPLIIVQNIGTFLVRIQDTVTHCDDSLVGKIRSPSKLKKPLFIKAKHKMLMSKQRKIFIKIWSGFRLVQVIG